MEKTNSTKLNNLNKILWFAIGLFVVLVSIYFYFIYGLTDDEKGTWGTFGDFIGGTLNPIFALFSLFAIIYTIKIQTQELELSRKELEETRAELKEFRIAQQEQSESLKLQNEATKLQIFENTFFQLLNQHNEYLDLMIDENDLKYKKVLSRDNYGQIKNYISLTIDEIKYDFKTLNNSKRSIKNYFMTLYQILKFINEKSIEQNINEKFYTNIIRALIDENVLKTLAVNCITYEFETYKKYLEDYNFFEHIYIENISDDTITILDVLKEYDKKAFGKNKDLILLIFGEKQ